jgi:hypothetical protein
MEEDGMVDIRKIVTTREMVRRDPLCVRSAWP